MMKSDADASTVSVSEKPVLFGRARSLIGTTCAPADRTRARRECAVVFLNAGIIHRIGPNRMYVNAARRMAGLGFTSLRFDLGGIGDSTMPPDEGGSVQETANRDIADAIDEATRTTACDNVVLVGLCSGADNALQAAIRDSRVRGIILVDPNMYRPATFYLHHYARRVIDPRRWARVLTGRHPIYSRLFSMLRSSVGKAADSEEPPFLPPVDVPSRDVMQTQFLTLAKRDCAMLIVFSGGGDEPEYNHPNQFFHAFPALRRNEAITLRYVPDADHTFSTPRLQRTLIDTMLDWLVDSAATSASAPGRPEGHHAIA